MPTPANSIVDRCINYAEDRWGKDARARLGETLYWALVNEQVLIFAAGQDESIHDSTIRRIVVEGYAEILNRRYPDG